MAHITRIKARDPHKKPDAGSSPDPKPTKKTKINAKATKTIVQTDTKKTTKVIKTAKVAEKADAKAPAKAQNAKQMAKKSEQHLKEKDGSAKRPKNPILRFITWPFRYLHESWLELRQVRWPSRGAAWKMVLAVIIYTALFITIIMLLDALFTFLFSQLFTK